MSRSRKPHLRCPDCRLHRSLCICALLPRIETRTRVVLIVHQLEATKPTNTGLLAARCLVNSAVVFRGRRPDGGDGAPVDEALVLTGAPLMLFPHETATPLDEWRGGGGPVTLIVPDGTWAQASSTRRRTDALRGIPCVSLPAPAIEAGRIASREDGLRPSERIAGAPAEVCLRGVVVGGSEPVRGFRKLRQPTRPGRLATLEAVATALGILEGPAVRDALMHIYRVMTDRTLWSNGRLTTAEVTGGIPPGVASHDPLRPARVT